MISQKVNNQLKTKYILLLILLSTVILITRRPDVFTHPQLWAEDGAVFLYQVWNGDILSSLLTPRDGYFQTLPKLTMAFASMFDLKYVSLISVVIATLIRLAFITFILSSRFNSFDIRLRILFILYYLLQPNVQEGYINITNTHTYLAIYLLAIIISEEPKSRLWKAHDLIVLAVSGVSGPFIALLAPSLALKRLYQRGGLFVAFKKINGFDLLFSLCFIIQVSSVVFGSFTRTQTSLGANLLLFFDIISYKIIFGSFIDLKYVDWVFDKEFINAVLTCILLIAVIYVFIKTKWKSKAVILYIALSLFVSLYKPVISHSGNQWPLFFSHIVGSRYFIVTGMGAFCLVLYYLTYVIKHKPIILYVAFIVILVCLCFSYRMPRLDNVGYSEDINAYNKASIGEHVRIRINPPGWEMNLLKK
ncbi:glucosyl transferase [Tatumella sp. JGM130]|uniref:glucosyl transferase n=1 Tax=Tatumella sp. JGM130 TaxID=2799797 RepID=UPI001BAF3575|nr:glucosyl transferase [Tatumella sp. JGM130]MBS0893942.1 glucosyl transferase [Tatumella sp. JGM130]